MYKPRGRTWGRGAEQLATTLNNSYVFRKRVHIGGGGVNIGQNSVYVVCTRPLMQHSLRIALLVLIDIIEVVWCDKFPFLFFILLSHDVFFFIDYFVTYADI